MTSKKSLLMMAIAAALMLPSSLALAQNKGPVYIAPKVMLSHQMPKDYENTMTQQSITTTPADSGPSVASITGFNHVYNGGSGGSDNVMGGGLAVGYDFYAAGYDIPIRTELEFLARAGSNASYGPGYNGTRMLNTTWSLIPTGSIAQSFFGQHTLDTKVYTVMANAYFDIHTDTAFTPYVGGGIGGAYLDTKSASVYGNDLDDSYMNYTASRNTWNFAYNVGAGVAFDIRENIALDLGYRYSNFGKAESGDGGGGYWYTSINGQEAPFNFKSKNEMDAHEITLGLRISAF